MNKNNIEISKERQMESLKNKSDLLVNMLKLLRSEVSLQHVAAVSFARLGFNILPISLKSKIPKKIDGYEFGTTDLSVINSWWTRWPKANIALCLDNLIVLSFDLRQGVNSYQVLIEHSPNEEQLPITNILEFPARVYNYIFKTKNEGIHSCKNCPIRGVSVLSKDKYLQIDVQTDIAEKVLSLLDVSYAPQWLVDLIVNQQANMDPLTMPSSMSKLSINAENHTSTICT